MTKLKIRVYGKRQQRYYTTPLPNGDEDRRRKSVCGSYPDLDTVLWLKRVALNPCKEGASREKNKKSCDRILNVRKVMLMTNTESPRRKRKLKQFLKSNSRPVTEKYNQKNFSMSRGHTSIASTDSRLLNLANSGESFNPQVVQKSRSSGSSEDNFEEKLMAINLSFLDDAINFIAPSIKYRSPLNDSDESVNGSNPATPENLNLQGPSQLDANDSSRSSYSSSSKEPKQLNIRRMTVPFGPRFQADVPGWTEPVNKGKPNGVKGDPENLKRRGTRVWPVRGESRAISLKGIGKGRPDSCSCVCPGSSKCIKHHILEKRLHLQSELGPAFFTWKFDEMGEAVSNSWTRKEQENFFLLRLKSSLTDETDFWEQASKCSKRVLSYYFNVFIPRRLSIETKIFSKQVDSDDEEEVEEDDQTNSQDRCKANNDGSCKSNNVKTRYLRRRY